MSAPEDRVALVAVRRELEKHRRATRESVTGLAKRPEGGTAQGFGKRIGDGTTEAVGRLTEIGVGGSPERALQRIERALAKLDDGTSGIRDACGGPIEPDRLRARRDSVLCLARAAAERRAAPPRRR